MAQPKLKRCLLALGVVLLCVMVLAQPVLAWQVGLSYGHLNRFGGEADSGWHRGQVEIAGAERRVRAGDDYIRWTQGGIDYWAVNGDGNNRPAMVYHAFAAGAGNDCGDIRIVDPVWSWFNTPNTLLYIKRTCGSGSNNEIRFMIYGYNQLVANQPYYVQHLFKDERWSNTGGTQRGTGKITVDTYHDRNVSAVHWGHREDYHTVFCVSGTEDKAIACP